MSDAPSHVGPPAAPPEPLSLEAALGLLDQTTDPLWLAPAALFISSSPDAALGNVAVALARAWEATTGFEEAARAAGVGQEGQAPAADAAERREVLAARREIGERRRRLRTWIELLGGEGALKQAEDDKRKAEKAASSDADALELEDDPWAELEESSDDDGGSAVAGGRVPSRADSARSTATTAPVPRTPLPFDLPTFLAAPLPYLALLLTTPPQLRSLAVFVAHHRDALAPIRFTLLESIPDWVQPELFRALLPQCDDDMEHELPWAAELVRADDDADEMAWLGSDEAHQILGTTAVPLPADLRPHAALLTAEELSAWYRRRIESIEATSGLVDLALAYLQHAVSRSVPDLDALGEDLSLLSKLVYDARAQASSSASAGAAIFETDVSQWTLARWRAASPEDVTAGYLRYATPATVVPIIRSLLLPYLFVLLSRSERTDTPDPTIPSRLIQSWLLTAPLDLAVEVFAASKATLPEHERILKRDEEVAREALAILYGSARTDRWDVMSRIFECMPAWTFGPEDHEDGEGSMTLLALSQFLRPTSSSPAPAPADLHTFFLPLRAPALSLLLDTLDLHLDSAETFARWGVPAHLGWFILSSEDRAEQLSWATRLARRGGERAEANEAAKGRRVGKSKAATEGWEALLRDMRKLWGNGEGALGQLDELEVVKVFFGGLLSSGNFSVAKSMLNARPPPLDRTSVEELVLAASREFYENAESGNLHAGEMKQAYSCLSVISPPTPAIEKEQAFIEATSRITSYNLPSRLSPSSTLAPLEIRLSKDRLSIVSRILSTSDDAYKHPEVILELVGKLGYQGDKAAECKTLGMLADAAVQEGDWERGVGYVERMVAAVQAFGRKKRARDSLPTSAASHTLASSAALTSVAAAEVDSEQEAVDVCWKTCYQFGRQSEFKDVERKLSLMGHALDFCPADTISDLLVAWRKLEDEALRHPQKRGAPRGGSSGGGPAHALDHLPSIAVSAASQLTGMRASDLDHMRRRDIAAAAASRTINTLSSSLSSFRPLGGGSSVRSASPASSMHSQPGSAASGGAEHSVASLFGGLGKEEDQDVVRQGRRALTKGVGWLLGASEEEMGGDLL